MGTFRQRNPDVEPTILVGWAAGLVRIWPEETAEPIECTDPNRPSVSRPVQQRS